MKNLNLNLENIKYKTGDNKVVEFEIDSKFEGTLSLKDLIVYKTNNEIKVYDRICDHAGGRLITNNNGDVICTLHKWQFNPERELTIQTMSKKKL